MLKKCYLILSFIFIIALVSTAVFFYSKYHTTNLMILSIEELSPTEYIDDPATRSLKYGHYQNRKLRLVKKDPTHFDFIFESSDPKVATIALTNIDLSLYIPSFPETVRDNRNLEIIALVEREWNRQQVSFSPHSPHLDIRGGDGFEKKELASVELARNCLNAGLWELLLFTQEEGQKALYYHGWFNFPLGHYKDVFEQVNQSSYWKDWYRLEHWIDPAGQFCDLSDLRDIITEVGVEVWRKPNDQILLEGEQKRKTKLMQKKGKTTYPSFVSPGRYDTKKPWNFDYETIAELKRATVRSVSCPDQQERLQEIEIIFNSSRDGSLNKLVIGGINLSHIPKLSEKDYPKGLYMPMGIGVPPFYQSYEDLKKSPPYQSPYYSLLLDEKDHWINHHEVAIDGPILHWDLHHPHLLHLYLMSYERHNLTAHFVLSLSERD